MRCKLNFEASHLVVSFRMYDSIKDAFVIVPTIENGDELCIRVRFCFFFSLFSTQNDLPG